MDTQRITQLVIEAQQGNSASMEALIESHYRDIYYFALQTVKNEDIAADITQESCLEITRTLTNLRDPSRFPAWVRRITYHQCTRYFKKTKDVIPDLNEEGESIFDTLPDEMQDTEPEAVYEDKEFKMTMRALVNSLPSEQSSALLLYYYEKMSVQQIAEIQGVADGTVKSRLNYARKAFKQKVEEYEKRTGVRLHAATPIAVLLAQLFKQGFAELPIPQISLPGISTASASAGTAGVGGTSGIGGTVAGAASSVTTAVGSAVANAVGAAAAVGSGAVGVTASVATSGGSNPPAKPSAKTEKIVSRKAAAGATAKAVANKAADAISDAATDTSPSPKNDGSQAKETKKKSKSPLVPIICGLLGTAVLAAGAFIGIKFFMNNNAPEEDVPDGTHEHYTTREWEYYDDYHYHVCDVCDGTMDKADHYSTGKWHFINDRHYQICDVCNGHMNEGTHQSKEWISFAEGHCKICTKCGVTYASEAHTPRSEWKYDNTEHYRVCRVCEAEYEEKNHTLGKAWKYDNDNHYHACTTCDYKKDVTPHSADWEYDRTEHYKICSCGKELVRGAHNYENGMCVCGRAYVPFDLTYTLNDDQQSYSITGLVELNESHLVIPETYNGMPVTAIGEAVFADCKQLEKVTLPYNITRIETGAFMNCTALSSINLDNITYLGDEAFMGCSSLDSIDLSDALTSMGQGVFRECTSLKSIVLPDSLYLYLPAYSFYGCMALTDVVLPRAIVDLPEDRNDEYWDILNEHYNFGVGDYAFAECRNLVNVDIDNNFCGFGAHTFENCVSLKKLVVPYNPQPGAFMEIAPYTFAGCTSLESIEHKEPFAIIYEGAFSGCINLKSISIGNHSFVAEIQKDAFKDCHSLSIQFDGTSDDWHTIYRQEGWADPSMIVHCTDKDIDHLTHSYQFDMWSYNAETHWRSCDECGIAEEEWLAEPHNIVDRVCTVCGMEVGSAGLEYELNTEENGYILVYLGDCTDTEIYIPSMYNGLPVVGIGASVFEGCGHITAVHIPDSVQFIGSGAFLGTSITEITIPDGVTVIEDNTFGMCQNLVTVNLPESVRSIYMFAFSDCSSLAEIDLSNVRFIGSFAFRNCEALTEVSLTDALIEDNAFNGSGVVTVTLTGECELYASVFMNCESLTTVYLPASITYIDICTFQNCTSLTHIYFDGTIEEWNSMDRMEYEEDMDEMEMELLWNYNTGDYVIHCTDGDLAK